MRQRTMAFWLGSAVSALPLLTLAGLASGAASGEVPVPGPVPILARGPADPFAPPLAPLLLVRTLHSPLADGREIVTRRTYQVSIRPLGTGYQVDGMLLACDVDAPESLRALAEIERTREDPGLFPLLLDAGGMIVETASPAGEAPPVGYDRERLSQAISAVMDGASRSPQERRDAEAFVQKVQARPVITPLPTDLFHPAPGRQVDRKQVALPDGTLGWIVIERDATGGGPGGVLGGLSRTVTTQMGGRSRITREEWTLRTAE